MPDNQANRRPLGLLKWLAIGNFVVVVSLFLVKYTCNNTNVKLFTSIFAIIFLWVTTIFNLFMSIRSLRNNAYKFSNFANAIGCILWILFLLYLTVLVIQRGGVF